MSSRSQVVLNFLSEMTEGEIDDLIGELTEENNKEIQKWEQ